MRASAQRREIPDGVIPGLYLIVQPSGFKSWALRYRVNGRSAKHTIGPAGVLELAAARAAARTALATIAEGGNPAAAKRMARENPVETFEVIAARFIARFARLHNKSWRQSERILQREAVPRWRHRQIGSITRPDVVALLNSIVDRGSPVAANRCLEVIRRLFNWAVERGTLETSPCDRVRDPAPNPRRDRVHSDDELRAIWKATDTLGYPFGPIIRLLMLTGQRREEVAGMQWGEISDDLTLWTLPAERVKNKTKHEVPLSPPAREILASLPRIETADGFVFSITGRTSPSGFSKAKHRLDAAISPPLAPWVLHDLRRSVASGMARLGVRLEVIEKVLNHTGGSFAGVAGVYQRHTFAQEKQAALELWARHILSLSRRPKRQQRHQPHRSRLGAAMAATVSMDEPPPDGPHWKSVAEVYAAFRKRYGRLVDYKFNEWMDDGERRYRSTTASGLPRRLHTRVLPPRTRVDILDERALDPGYEGEVEIRLDGETLCAWLEVWCPPAAAESESPPVSPAQGEPEAPSPSPPPDFTDTTRTGGAIVPTSVRTRGAITPTSARTG